MKAKRSRLDKEDGVHRKLATKRVTRGSVLKMLAAMESPAGSGPSGDGAGAGGAAGDAVADFLTTGRTGRRNAMPDILGCHANTSVADLPDCLGKLHTADHPSTSGGGSSGCVSPCNPFGPSTSRSNAPDVSNASNASNLSNASNVESPTQPSPHDRDETAS